LILKLRFSLTAPILAFDRKHGGKDRSEDKNDIPFLDRINKIIL